MGRRFIYDIESNGLLDTITKIHMIVLRDLDSKEVLIFVDQKQSTQYPPIEDGLAMLQAASFKAAHNGVEFDDIAIAMFYPQFKIQCSLDTMVVARASFTNIKDNDYRLFKRGRLPAECLVKPHTLKAWGYRLGNFKGEYTGGWEALNQDMIDYCVQDTSTTESLLNLLLKRHPMLIETEMEVALWLRDQKINGFPFNHEAAQSLYCTLLPERMQHEHNLKDLFPPWYVAGKTKLQSRTVRYKRAHLPLDVRETFIGGSEWTPIKRIEFNPSSRDHIAHVFMAKGWKPQDFTPAGKPAVNDDIIGALPYPEAKAVCDYLLLDKRIGALAEGDQAWMKCVAKDGRIHGQVNQTGAPTHRASHSKPNMTAVPKVGNPYGQECRSLFGVPPGWKEVGVDVSGLELRGLSHYMHRFDGGVYMKLILEGDVHTANLIAGKPYLASRDNAKTFIYAFLYGAGDWKLGHICRPLASDEEKSYIGRSLRALFLKNVSALGELIKIVHQRVTDKKSFTYPTGHEVWPVGKHSALNYLIQALGAIICKRWIYYVSLECKRRGLVSGWQGDYAALVWAHDEIQVAVREQGGRITPQEFGEMVLACIPLVQADLKLTVPLSGTMKIGDNWAECH